jgi:predicted membrane protein
MKKKSVFWGLLLILLAVYLIVSRLGLIPRLPIITIVFTVIFVYMIIQGIIKRNFFMILLPAALIGCMYAEPWNITRITPWPLLIAALLVSIGLTMIFKDSRKKNEWKNVAFSDSHMDSSKEDSAEVVCNAFGEINKYVNSSSFSKALIKNTFGQSNLFFNNAIIANNHAMVEVKNSFGEVNLYLPGTWRVDVQRDCAFGEVRIHGNGNADMDAPLVQILADCSFGEINIYFEG